VRGAAVVVAAQVTLARQVPPWIENVPSEVPGLGKEPLKKGFEPFKDMLPNLCSKAWLTIGTGGEISIAILSILQVSPWTPVIASEVTYSPSSETVNSTVPPPEWLPL
jgi:hypothetical protein